MKFLHTVPNVPPSFSQPAQPTPTPAAIVQATERVVAKVEATETRDNKFVIPKVIHQVWIGHKIPPMAWINTWRIHYIGKNPGWTYRLWREKDVNQLVEQLGDGFINRDLMERAQDYAGKVDVIRLNILKAHGGVYIDADSEWINNKSLNPILEKADGSGFFVGQEPPLPDKPPLLFANGVMGSTANHWFLDKVLEQQRNLSAANPGGASWQTLGPMAMTAAVTQVGRGKITTLPPETFYPQTWVNVGKDNAFDASAFPNSYMRQLGYTTNGYTDEDISRQLLQAGRPPAHVSKGTKRRATTKKRK